MLFQTTVYQSSFAENKNESCISYNILDKIITIKCKSANLSTLYYTIKDDNILKNESNKIWSLNAHLIIRNNSTFYINSTDTSWLKLISNGNDTSKIKAYGDLLIDSVKITSWNNTNNNYALTDGNIPRSHISASFGTGSINITNSEVAYLGYHKGGENGIAYMNGGHYSMIKNNTIHHQWFGIYFNNAKGVTIENNHFHDNNRYAIDPHTGTNDMVIRDNLVHDTKHKLGAGIICSLDCYDILIEENEVYNNHRGIVLHRNTTNSIVQNNIVYNSFSGIEINESSKNQVFNNSLHYNDIGIEIKFNETKIIPDIGKGFTANNNLILNNTILDSKKNGILVKNGASENIIRGNIIEEGQENGIYVLDEHSQNNLFLENKLINTKNPIQIENNTSSTFVNNIIFEKQNNPSQNFEKLFIKDYAILIISILAISFGIIFFYFRKKKNKI